MKAVADRLVVDASVTLAWCFEDESTDFTDAVLDLVSGGVEIIAPSIWPFEVANVLLVAEHRKRISIAQATVFLERIAQYSISIETVQPFRVFGGVRSLARQERLTVYEAAYAELALRRDLPLATLDDQLRRAAKAVGIRLLNI